MKVAAKMSALLVFVGLVSFSSVAAAQYAPPPPPPPSPGPEVMPPPAADPAPPPAAPQVAPPATPYPNHCGVAPAPPCYRPAPRYHRPRRFWRLGLYLGAGVGGFGVLGAKGSYEQISAGGFGSAWVGLYLTRRFALELGFIGSVHREQFSEVENTYWDENELMLWGVTLDAKFNLVRPGWRRRFVPYLQAGVGYYGLVGDYYDELSYYSGSRSLTNGGGVQLGGGIDIYLARWLVLGARVLYRGIVFGDLKCGSDRCARAEEEKNSTVLHGLTGEINMSIVF